MVRILAIAPIIGSTGDTVNEYQTLMAVSQYSKEVFVITPLDVRALFKRTYKTYLTRRPPTMRVLPIPFALLPFDQLWIVNIPIFTLYSLVFLFIVYFLDLYKNFDLIYIRDPRFALFISFSKRLSRKTFVKIAALVEEGIYTDFLRRLTELIVCSIDRHVMSRVAGVVVHSIEFAKHLVLRRRFLPRKIIELPPGITWAIINRVKKYCPRTRKDYSKGEVVIGFLGLLAKWQGVDILCDVVAELNRRGCKAKLKVIGDGPLRRFLVNRCRSLGVEVEITGFIPHHKALCMARKEFDVLVLPRIQTETTSSIVPIKVIEALALGIPVITTDLPAYKKLEGRGLYTSKRTPKHFADTILKVLANPSKVVSSLLLQRYSYEFNVKRFLRIALGSRT